MDVAAHRPQARTARLRPDYIGTVGVLRRADDARLKLARRSLREIPETEIEGQGLHLVEKSSGETWEIITSFVDLVDVKQTGAEAFVIRDGWLVPLRPVGWKTPRTRAITRAKSAAARRRAAILYPCPAGGSSDERSVLDALPQEILGGGGLAGVGEGGTAAGAAGYGAQVSSRTADRPDFSRATSGPATLARLQAVHEAEKS